MTLVTHCVSVTIERKMRGRSGFDIIGPENLYLLMTRGNGNVAYGVLRDILDLRSD